MDRAETASAGVAATDFTGVLGEMAVGACDVANARNGAVIYTSPSGVFVYGPALQAQRADYDDRLPHCRHCAVTVWRYDVFVRSRTAPRRGVRWLVIFSPLMDWSPAGWSRCLGESSDTEESPGSTG